MASADLTVLRYVAETVPGTTPATPALAPIRYTGESLNFNIENIQTNEITPTAVETDLIQVGAESAGDIKFELSYGSFDVLMAAAVGGAWATNVLENGILLPSFTIQKHFQDMTTPQYHNFQGCVIDAMNLEFEVGKILEGSFTVKGRAVAQTATQIAGATFPAATTTSPMNAVGNLQDISFDGVPYTGCVSKMSLNVKSNIRSIMCVGTLGPADMKRGTLEVTGDLMFYFNEETNYGLFLAGTEFALTFELDDGTSQYQISLPRCKFETGEVVAGGRNSDVMFNAKFRALLDGTAGHVIEITRVP